MFQSNVNITLAGNTTVRRDIGHISKLEMCCREAVAQSIERPKNPSLVQLC